MEILPLGLEVGTLLWRHRGVVLGPGMGKEDEGKVKRKKINRKSNQDREGQGRIEKGV